MSWMRMSIDDYAALSRQTGTRVCRAGGIWWQQVRPCFYRPLSPFVQFAPGAHAAPAPSRLVGYHHLVPGSGAANATMGMLVYDRPHDYSLERLDHAYRKNVRKGLRHLVLRPVDSLDELVNVGHRVFASFHTRTGYPHMKKQVQQGAFARWADALFAHPEVRVLGAYRGGELCAVAVAVMVEDAIVSPTYFASTEALRLRVSEVMLHYLRAEAALCPAARYLFLGMAGSKASLDRFKVSRGCTLLRLPAYCRINPVARLLASALRPRDYERLGLTRHQDPDPPAHHAVPPGP